jgi:hypothetical protein
LKEAGGEAPGGRTDEESEARLFHTPGDLKRSATIPIVTYDRDFAPSLVERALRMERGGSARHEPGAADQENPRVPHEESAPGDDRL